MRKATKAGASGRIQAHSFLGAIASLSSNNSAIVLKLMTGDDENGIMAKIFTHGNFRVEHAWIDKSTTNESLLSEYRQLNFGMRCLWTLLEGYLVLCAMSRRLCPMEAHLCCVPF